MKDFTKSQYCFSFKSNILISPNEMSSVHVDLASTVQSIIPFIPPDFTIITNDGAYPCQRLLAAAQSHLIRDHITSNLTSKEIILDFDDKKHQFNLIINLFNGQEIEINEENAFFLLNAASVLKFPWLTNQIRHLTIHHDGTNSIDYNPENPLNGIFSYLEQFYQNSISIKVSSSTAYGVPESLIYQHTSGEYWESQSMQPNPWFQINLLDKKVNLVGYVLQTTSNASDSRNPNSWIVAGSNDGENWHTLCQIDKKSDLYEPNIAVAFECTEKENDEPYSMFRFEMTEPTYQGDWTFRIARVELFGDLYGEVCERDPLLIYDPDLKVENEKVKNQEFNTIEEKDIVQNAEETALKAEHENNEKIDQINTEKSNDETQEETPEKSTEEIEKADNQLETQKSNDGITEQEENNNQVSTEKVIENSQENDELNNLTDDPDLPQPENGIVAIGYDEENPLKGVFYYLSRKRPNSITIDVSSNSSYGEPDSIIFQGVSGSYWESSSSQPNPWFQINLHNARLDIIGYVIKTTFHSSDSNYPNSWILAGSNNGEEWFTLDQIDNKSSLIESNTAVAFECADKDSEEAFKIFRFEMTEPTVDGTWCFRLARVELFGDLYIDDAE